MARPDGRDVQKASNVVELPRSAVSVKNTSYARRLKFPMMRDHVEDFAII